MQRSIRRSVCALLALTALCLTGAEMQCPWKRVVVEIPDLEVNQVQGLQFWRANQQGSLQLTEAGRLVFGQSIDSAGSEVLEFTLFNSRNEPIEVYAPANVLRREGEAGPVTLDLTFAYWDEPPGWFRVTTFNEVGESEVSDEAVYL